MLSRNQRIEEIEKTPQLSLVDHVIMMMYTMSIDDLRYLVMQAELEMQYRLGILD